MTYVHYLKRWGTAWSQHKFHILLYKPTTTTYDLLPLQSSNVPTCHTPRPTHWGRRIRRLHLLRGSPPPLQGHPVPFKILSRPPTLFSASFFLFFPLDLAGFIYCDHRKSTLESTAGAKVKPRLLLCCLFPMSLNHTSVYFPCFSDHHCGCSPLRSPWPSTL